MATVYDVLGVIFGITSLLAVVEQARRLIDARLPPGRLRDLQDALAATRMLVERLERIGCLEDVNVAGTYRNRITELDKQVDMLWVEAERWRQMDVTRRFLPCNRIDLLRDCSHLQREIDGVCADLWLLPSPPLQKSRASPLAPPVPSTTPTSSIRPDGSAAKAAQSSAVPTPLPAPRRTTSPSRPRPPSPQHAPPAQPLWVSLAKFIMRGMCPAAWLGAGVA